jgi:5-formaminoimidazole-4-carboxamide-1-beta-D-ribofuranosyl 5'-monophosphate synthetase
LAANTELETLDKRADSIPGNVKRLRYSAKRQAQLNRNAHYAREGDRPATMLRKNPHKFFRVMKKIVPETTELHDESSGPSDQKAVAFREFFMKLFMRMSNEPDGLLFDRFLRGIPRTD